MASTTFIDRATNIQASWLNDVNDLTYGTIVTNTTLNVPTQYTTISAALTYLADKVISKNATVTIQVADGVYTQGAVNTLAHPQGARIKILGNIITPANCLIQCASSDAFYVPPGYTIGEINGFKLQKTGTKAQIGVLADGSEIIKLGPNLLVDNFYYGVAARYGSTIIANGTSSTNRILITNAGDVAFWAFHNSFLSADYGEAQNASDAPNSLGIGALAEFSSAISFNNGKATGCFLAGVGAYQSSAMRAFTVTSTGNQHGIITIENGVVEVFNGSTIASNTGYGHKSDGTGLAGGLSTATITPANTLGLEFTPVKINSDNTWVNNGGRISADATRPEQTATSGDAVLEGNAKANRFIVLLAQIAGVERGRIQYRDDLDRWDIVAGSNTLLRAFDTGKVTIGKGAPATGDTANVGVQIPAVAGQPTGVISDNQGGYVSLVYDTTNNKLWVYNGAWRGVTLT